MAGISGYGVRRVARGEVSKGKVSKAKVSKAKVFAAISLETSEKFHPPLLRSVFEGVRVPGQNRAPEFLDK